ncbi:MAG: hypothetical protein AAGI07_12115, partial [Bacteroidota bacterium]
MRSDVDTTVECEIQLCDLINRKKFTDVLVILKNETGIGELSYLIDSENNQLNFNVAYSFCDFMLKNDQEEALWQK